MTGRRARGSYAKGAATRREILDAAMVHFAERGYDRASVREIARRAGITQAGLIHHFATKEELYLAVLAERDARVGTESVDWAERPAVQQLLQAVRLNADQPGLVRLFATMSAETLDSAGPGQGFFAERYEWLRGELAADISRRTGDAERIELTPDELASLLIAAADGLQLQWLHDPERIDMARLLGKLAAGLGVAPDEA